MNIYYLSASGTKIDFKGKTYRIQTGDLFEYEWGYESTSYTNRNGGRVNKFTRGITKKEIKIAVTARSKDEYYSALNTLFETIESDVRNLTPGRLYVGEYYLTCYLYKAKAATWESGAPFQDKTLYVVTEYPFWCKEKDISYFPKSENLGEGVFLDYPYDYPYDYSCNLTASYLENDNYSDSDFKMIIYGPCVNPSVLVGNHLYEVILALYDGEYLTIDSRDNSIIRVRNSGDVVNEFNSRNKDYSIFQKIPKGRSAISWNGNFGFDITLFQERSEPKWRY